MRFAFTILAAIFALSSAVPAFTAESEPNENASALRKLYALGYPADTSLAIQRWRAENGRRETGELTPGEATAIGAQPNPEFLAAMAGNPFTGLGLAMRHTTREDAEREAIKLCKANGGGGECVNPMVVRAEQCVGIVGYSTTIDRRPTYRTSVAVSKDIDASLNAAKEACPVGASHPALCRPLLSFCGNGEAFKVFE
jgi:hypothetical protein